MLVAYVGPIPRAREQQDCVYSALAGLAGNDDQPPRAALGGERAAQMRKIRRRRSEQRRLSDSRKIYVERNTGLSRTDPNYLSLDKVANGDQDV